jgi:hypothetical protein
MGLLADRTAGMVYARELRRWGALRSSIRFITCCDEGRGFPPPIPQRVCLGTYFEGRVWKAEIILEGGEV